MKTLTKDEIVQMIENRDNNIKNTLLITKRRREARKKGQYPNNFTSTLIDMYSDIFTRGMQLWNPQGKILQYGNLSIFPTYYRGENKKYNSKCRSSLGRILEKAPNQHIQTRFFISQLRIVTFSEMISQLKQVQEWKFGDVFAYMIAQHYGMPTQYLDITDDPLVALFFACCKYSKNGKYEPITEKDFNKYGRYGYLYKRYSLGSKNAIAAANGNVERILSDVLEIGYQPFTRCYKQRGYYIDTNRDKPCWDYDLVEDGEFKKLRFKRSPVFCQKIYERFHGGDDLFPKDASSEITEIVQSINQTRVFSKNSFDTVFHCYYANSDMEETANAINSKKDWWLHQLSEAEIYIKGQTFIIPDNTRKKIDAVWNLTDFVEAEHLAIGHRDFK